MKKVKKSSTYEPTISDVLNAVQNGFAQHEKILTHHEDILTELQTGSARHDKLLTALYDGQKNLKEQVTDISRRLINTQNRVEDIADIVELNHEHRIRRLETVSK
jgi:hypothetical protein